LIREIILQDDKTSNQRQIFRKLGLSKIIRREKWFIFNCNLDKKENDPLDYGSRQARLAGKAGNSAPTGENPKS